MTRTACSARPSASRRWHYEDDDCWVADCVVCMTPMVVWRTHGLPDADLEAACSTIWSGSPAARYGDDGY